MSEKKDIAFQCIANNVNFEGMLSAVRALQPTCVDCGRSVQEALTGVRKRQGEDGVEERLCRDCANAELGEMLITRPPV